LYVYLCALGARGKYKRSEYIYVNFIAVTDISPPYRPRGDCRSVFAYAFITAYTTSSPQGDCRKNVYLL
jgi:hypothetical protein